jgi:hypothetical protein
MHGGSIVQHAKLWGLWMGVAIPVGFVAERLTEGHGSAALIVFAATTGVFGAFVSSVFLLASRRWRMTAAIRAPFIALVATAPFWVLAMSHAVDDPSYPATDAVLFSLPFLTGALVVAFLAEVLILGKPIDGGRADAT